MCLKIFYTVLNEEYMITVQSYINSFFAIRRGLSSCILPRFVLHGTKLWVISLPRNGSERNFENLRLFLVQGTEFQVVTSSVEGFGTEFREDSVPRNSRNSVWNPPLFRLLHLPPNYFMLEIPNPNDELIRASHFSSFLHILPLKQYNSWISKKNMKTQIILHWMLVD